MNPEHWHPVFESAALAGGGTREFRVQGVSGFAVRAHGQLSAYLNQCPHQGLQLNWRPHDFLSADHLYIVCANHGAMFDCFSGICLAGPCSGAALTPWAIREQSGLIEVADPPGRPA